MQLSISNQFKLYGILLVCVPFLVITLLGLVSYREKTEENLQSLVEFGLEITQFNIQKNVNILNAETRFIAASLQEDTHTLSPNIREYIKQVEPQLIWSVTSPKLSHLLDITPIQNCSTSLTGVITSSSEGYPRLYYYAQQMITEHKHLLCIQTAMPLDKKLRLQSILKHYSNLGLRIVVFSNGKAQTISASNKPLGSLNNDWTLHPPKPHTYHIETLNKHHFISGWQPLNDPLGKPIGGIIVSAPQASFWDYFSDKLLYFWLTALLCVMVIILIGNRFHYDWLFPLEQIIETLKGVSMGNYQIRLNLNPRPVPLKNLQDNFNRILTVFEEEKKLRETFISCLAHDLKTPLYSQKRIISALQTDNANFDEETKAILFNLLQTNNELYELVQLLLESYRNDDVAIELTRTACVLTDLITECKEALYNALEKKHIQVTLTTTSPLIPIPLDRLQIKRVFTNLLQNAIDHSREGGSIEFVLSQGKGGTLCSIQDNGSGISPESKPYIFQRYWSTKNRQQTLSSGLGLYIVRMIVEAHGGTITVESELNKGTMFTLYLPHIDLTQEE